MPRSRRPGRIRSAAPGSTRPASAARRRAAPALRPPRSRRRAPPRASRPRRACRARPAPAARATSQTAAAARARARTRARRSGTRPPTPGRRRCRTVAGARRYRHGAGLTLRELRPLARLLQACLRRSLTRGSRVRSWRRLSSPRSAGSASISALAIPWRTASAWPEMPPPWIRARTSMRSRVARRPRAAGARPPDACGAGSRPRASGR